MSEPRHGPERYLDLMANTDLGKRLATPAGRRSALYDMLAAHPDPVWREMGEQLKNGSMRPSDMFAVPAYRERVMAGLEEARERHAELFGAVEQATEQAAEGPGTAAPQPAAVPDEDEPDEVPINWVRR
ncbi:hypothetical protein [Actinophytocola sp. NPDC049390]|uniref:hypothetical protein n=1 Tax=Actinophytocola sp. NPDC049390 TaxID=3363894 RepID=UPI0037889C1F